MKIRKAVASDEKGIRSLFTECFGKEMSYDEWAWKYNHSPWGSTSVVVVSDEDKIVAHYGGLQSRFFYKGRSFDVFQPCDVMTHSKYRARFFSKRGIMIKAGELFYSSNPMHFAFGFPSERHAILGTKQLGYTEHSYVSVLKKQTDSLKHNWNPLLKIETSWDLVNSDELDLLWEKVKNDAGLSIEKNSRYIFWRYRDNPVRQYSPLIIRSRFRKTLKAFAVFSVNENEISVLDFHFIKELEIRNLFKLLLNMAVRSGVGSLKLWMNPEEKDFQTLINDGFVREGGIPYIFKVLNKEIEPIFLFKNYHYRMGDYDVS